MLLVSVLVLGILVFVHELGHFLVAKWNGIAVIEFAVGFGRKIFRKRVGETIYAIGLIPLGGYVRMAGDEPWEMPVAEPAPEQPKGFRQPQAPGPEAPDQEELVLKKLLLSDPSRWFMNKPIWAKSLVVVAGPAFNFIFAWILAVVVTFSYGRAVAVDEPIVGQVLPSFPAETAGFHSQDKVLSINGTQIKTWTELSKIISASKGAPMKFVVQRDSGAGAVNLDIEVKAREEYDELAVLAGKAPEKVFRIGMSAGTRKQFVTLSGAMSEANHYVVFLSRATINGLVGMVKGLVSPKNIAGPLYIFKEAASSAEKGIETLLRFMIFLSVCLAVMNLLPIPVLDGGHLLFFAIEALKGDPLPPRIHEVANQLGMLILLLLMGFAIVNDLLKVLT